MNILDPWKAEGYQFDEGLNRLGAGKVRISSRSLCFFSEATPQKGTALTRLTIQAYLGRKLLSAELIRFKCENKKDQRKPNLVLHSKTATAKELYEINGPPILGYSHCMCRCGKALDVEKQGDQPHAFVMGHSPADKRRTDTLEAAVNGEKTKKSRRKKPTVDVPGITKEIKTMANPWDPRTWSLAKQMEMMKFDPVAGRVLAMTSDPLYQYRPLFEKMICDLPWEKFKCLLDTLMKMESLELQPCPPT